MLNTNSAAKQAKGVATHQHNANVQQNAAPQQSVAMVTPVVTAAQHVTVAQPSSLRATRIAKVQVLLHKRYRAAKVLKYTNATATHAQQAILAQVQALYASAGLPIPNTLSVRAVATTQHNPASAVQGACKQVRAFVHAHPTLTRKQVMQHFTGTNYINPATVSTQYQLAKGGKA